MKYKDYAVTFREFPNEISLCINISNCQMHCKECHSPELWEDVGKLLDRNTLAELIRNNKGITCVGLMGGDSDHYWINELAAFIKYTFRNIKVGWYSGYKVLPEEIDIRWFDYIKLGPYIKDLGGLNKSTTNQKMYAYSKYYSDYTIGPGWRDITNMFYGK